MARFGKVGPFHYAQGEDICKQYGLGETPEGGLAPGTRVVKCNSDMGDVMRNGRLGEVKGGILFDKEVNGHYVKYLYLVLFDGLPGMNLTTGNKLQEV